MCLIRPDGRNEKSQRVIIILRRDEMGAKKRHAGKNIKTRVQLLSIEDGITGQSAASAGRLERRTQAGRGFGGDLEFTTAETQRQFLISLMYLQMQGQQDLNLC